MQISSPNSAFSTVCIHYTAQFNLSHKQRAVSWTFSLDSLFSRPTNGKHWRKQFEIENHTKPLGWIYSKCFSTVCGGMISPSVTNWTKFIVLRFALCAVKYPKGTKTSGDCEREKILLLRRQTSVARRSSSCSLPSLTSRTNQVIFRRF